MKLVLMSLDFCVIMQRFRIVGQATNNNNGEEGQRWLEARARFYEDGIDEFGFLCHHAEI